MLTTTLLPVAESGNTYAYQGSKFGLGKTVLFAYLLYL